MFSIIFMLFSVQASLLPKNDFDEDLILKKFIGALEDKKTIESWKTDTQRDDLYFIDLFKGVLSKIRDVLVCIYTEKDTDIKSLILEANMILEKVSYPYFETLNIVKSVKRIILINDNQNTSKDDQLDTKFFIEDFLYKEYDLIYCNLEFAINQVGHIPDANKTTENYKECKNRGHCQNYKSMPIEQNHSFIISFMELSNEMIESILPSNNNTTSYVEAHMGGLIRSRKCTDNEIHLFIREKYTLVCPEDMSQCLKRCKSEQSDFTEFDLQDYMGKVFICSKTTAQVLIMLFHFFSETKKRNTKYEIIMKEDNEYQIKWSLSKQVFNKEIVNFWKEQEILDFANNKIIHKFGETMVCNCRYSTNRSDYLANKQKVDNRHLKNFKKRNPSFENTIEELENKLKHLKNEFNQAFYDEMNLVVEIETKPFKTKLFLFSCGHQILFKKLARFIYRSWYNNYLKPLKCPYYCGCGPIHIIGWYEAIVYKIK